MQTEDLKTNLAWAAGFLEGEGSFSASRPSMSLYISAKQVQLWPLKRLRKLFGGNIYIHTGISGKFNKDVIPQWAMSGARAVGLMMTLFRLMSPRRQKQIRKAIKLWQSKPPSFAILNRNKTHCKNGHRFTEANTYYRREGGRTCRVCRNASVRRCEERKVKYAS
jgi:hypothetical protein